MNGSENFGTDAGLPVGEVVVHREFTVEDRFFFRTSTRSMTWDDFASNVDADEPRGYATYDEARQAAINFVTEFGGGSFRIDKRTFVSVLPA